MSTPRPRLVAAAAMIGLVASMAPTVAGATQAPSRNDQPLPVLGAASTPAKVKGKLAATAVRSRFVALQEGSLNGKGAGSKVSFELFPGEVVSGTVADTNRTAGAATWSGSLDDGFGSWTAARVDGTFHISLQTPNGVFEINNAGGDTYRVSEVEIPEITRDDIAEAPAEEPTEPASTPVAPSTPVRTSVTTADAPTAGDVGNVADILVVATAQATIEAGGDAALAAHVNSAIAQMNGAMQRSGVPDQVRLAGLVKTTTTEVGGDLSTDLTRLRIPGDGYFDEAQSARETTHADVVSLWIGGTVYGSCGLGYLATKASQAYHALFAKQCATANLTFAHETGHNFRLEHDASASQPPSGTSAPYAHGHSYVDLATNTGWYTMMAYATSCRSQVTYCTRIQNYSNPAVLEGGVPTGTALANNARALAESFATVANYRQEQIHPAAPIIGGKPRFGKKLHVTAGTWLPSETTLRYQWFADGLPMKGRTKRKIRVGKSMIGRIITVLVTGTAANYAPVAIGSAPTPAMAKGKFRKRKVRLVGRAKVGRVLHVSTKLKPKAKRIKYKWFRSGKRIKHAKGTRYRLTRKDRGKKVYVKIKARKKGYATLVKKSNKRKIRR